MESLVQGKGIITSAMPVSRDCENNLGRFVVRGFGHWPKATASRRLPLISCFKFGASTPRVFPLAAVIGTGKAFDLGQWLSFHSCTGVPFGS